MKTYWNVTQFVNSCRQATDPNRLLRCTPRMYVVERDTGDLDIGLKPPRSYRKVKRALCLVGDRVAKRVNGVWVETASSVARLWLAQYELQEAFRRLREEGPTLIVEERSEASDVAPKLRKYLQMAVDELREEICRMITDAMARTMEARGEFSMLEVYGHCWEDVVGIFVAKMKTITLHKERRRFT